MPTASEIANQKFDKSIGGYRVEEVDSFLKKVADDYGKLLQEKEDLERKLEVLAEKLIEYREDEESLRTALLGAQKLGDSVIRESRTKAEIILRDATIKAERLVENAQKKIEHERVGLSRLQNEVAGFKNRLLGLYKQHLEIVSALPGEIDSADPVESEPVKTFTGSKSVPDEPLPPPLADDLEQQPKQEEHESLAVDDSAIFDGELLPFEALSGFSEMQNNNEDDDAGESLDSVFAAEEQKPAQSRFGPLKFGRDYDMNNDAGGKKRR